MYLKIILTLIITSYTLMGNSATRKDAITLFKSYLDGFQSLEPGFSVVVVTPDEVLLNYNKGVRNTSSKLPLTSDTPIYIASQTKAFIGLLAIKLDHKGILKLDSKISDFWPNLTLPNNLHASEWTLKDLLNHKVPIESNTITFIEAYISELNPKRYPKILKHFAKARQPGFKYDNLGYNIYTAILEHTTGKKWQDWLAIEILKPLKMKHSSAVTSDFDPKNLSWSHTWLGDGKGWHLIPPKHDSIMQSAGGMYVSPTDMGRWLQLHLKQDSSNLGFPQKLLDDSHKQEASIDPNANNPYELPCFGYSYGWNNCNFNGYNLYIHGGSYIGSRTIMAFSRELNIGIAVFSNSDNMTGWLTSRTLVQFLQFLTDDKNATRWATIRQDQYPKRTQRLLNVRQERNKSMQDDPRWDSWKWNPNTFELQEYVGKYQDAIAYIDFEINLRDGLLQLKNDAYKSTLTPAKEDLFATQNWPFDSIQEVKFTRNSGGKIVSFKFHGIEFKKKS